MKMNDPVFISCMREFLTTHLPVVKRRSENTIAAYRDAFRLYLQWLQKTCHKRIQDVCAADFSQEKICLFLNWLVEIRGNTAPTVNQRLSHLKSFCRFAINKHADYLPLMGEVLNIADMVDTRKDEFIWLSLEQMKLLLGLPDRSERLGLRDSFFLELLYDSGCRESEILDLKLQDFSKDGSGGAVIHVFGKGNKHRTTPISRKVVTHFGEYCKVFHKDMVPSDYIFYTMHGDKRTRMSPDNIALRLSIYERMAKEKDSSFPHLHAHLFRRTRAMLLYQNGMPLPLVSEWLGHSSIETTTIYAKATMEMKRDAKEKADADKDSIFHDAEDFKYADDEAVLKRLMGF